MKINLGCFKRAAPSTAAPSAGLGFIFCHDLNRSMTNLFQVPASFYKPINARPLCHASLNCLNMILFRTNAKSRFELTPTVLMTRGVIGKKSVLCQCLAGSIRFKDTYCLYGIAHAFMLRTSCFGSNISTPGNMFSGQS